MKVIQPLALVSTVAAFGAGKANSESGLDRRGWGFSMGSVDVCVGSCENGGTRSNWYSSTCNCVNKWSGNCCDSRDQCDGNCPAGNGGPCCDYTTSCDSQGDCDILTSDLIVNGKFVTDKGPRVNSKSSDPDTLKGVFWLSGQADSSALLTFAEPPNAGTAHHFGDDELPDGATEWTHHIQVNGDRTWAFADENGKSWGLVNSLGLTYHFAKKTDTYYHIIPEASSLGIAVPQWLLAFDMELMTAEQQQTDELTVKYCGGECGGVVWNRVSSILGNFDWAESARYALIQVVDANGNPIEPAWTNFMMQQNGDLAGDSVGDTNGVLHYRTGNP